MDEVRSNNNVVYRCTYHVVWCPKYRRIKGRSSRLLRDEFPHLKTRLPTLWTNSYLVATVGGATLDVVKRYNATSKTSATHSPTPTCRWATPALLRRDPNSSPWLKPGASFGETR